MADNKRNGTRAEEELQPVAGSEETGSGAPSAQPEESAGEALADALKSSFRFLKFVMVAAIILFLLTGIFWVPPDQVAFKLRFGRIVPVGGQLVLRPGTVHIRWPWETKIELRTDEQVLELEDEFWTGMPTTGHLRPVQSLDVRGDGYLLTGDVNLVHLKLRVRYRVRSDSEGAVAYRFYMGQPTDLLRRIAQAATNRVVARMRVMNVINRQDLLPSIEQELRRRLARFEQRTGAPLGVEVVAVETIEQEGLKNPSEPALVAPAFAAAQNAANQRDALASEGETEATTIVQNAQARRAEVLAEARGDAVRLVRAARADASKLEQLLAVYAQSAEQRRILREDFYERAVVQILQDSPGAFVLYEPPDGTSRELRIQLQKKPFLPTTVPGAGQ